MTCLGFFESILRIASLGINGGKEVSYGKKEPLSKPLANARHGFMILHAASVHNG